MAEIENKAALAVNEAINQELLRAGVGFDRIGQARRQEMTQSLLQGNPNQDAMQLLALLELGDGFSTANAEDVTREYGDGALFGVPAAEAWANQRKGWEGYGWTQEKVDKLGRMPDEFELSRGGREAWNWRRRRDFLESLAQQQKEIERATQTHMDREDAYTFGLHRMSSPEVAVAEDKRRHFLERALQKYDTEKDRTHGESGWLGSLQNPEYLAGHVMTNYMQPVSDALWASFYDKTKPQVIEHQSEDQGGGEVLAGLTNRHLPAAFDLAKNRTAANKVEPLIPNGMSPAEGRKLLHEMSQADVPNYDEWHRLSTGEYPTYAGSSVMTFLNGLLDPSLLATGPAARTAVAAGKAAAGQGLKMGALSGAKSTTEMLGNMLGRYGVSVAKAAREYANPGFLKSALMEGSEEVPTNVGINAAFAAQPHMNQPDKVNERTAPPLPSMFAQGNQARTDLYQWNPDAKVVDPDTGEETLGNWEMESDSAFRKRMAEKYANYDRMQRQTTTLHDSLPKSPLPQKPN